VEPIRIRLFDVAVDIAFKFIQRALISTKVKLPLVNSEGVWTLEVGQYPHSSQRSGTVLQIVNWFTANPVLG
jgi:hypothetical protein